MDVGVDKGVYIVVLVNSFKLDVIIIVIGLEVFFVIEVKVEFVKKDIDVFVVSLFSWECFEKIIDVYKESILLKEVIVRFVIEVGVIFGWKEFIGLEGDMLGIDYFGVFVFVKDLFNVYGFILENVVDCVEIVIVKVGVCV